MRDGQNFKLFLWTTSHTILTQWHIANPPCNTLVSPLPKCIVPHESSSTGVKTCASIPTLAVGCAMRLTTKQTHVAPRHPSTFETLSHHIFHVLLPSYISLKIAIHCDFISKLSPSNYINYINFFQLYRLYPLNLSCHNKTWIRADSSRAHPGVTAALPE